MYDVMASLHILINFFIIASGVPDAGGTPHLWGVIEFASIRRAAGGESRKRIFYEYENAKTEERI